MKKLVLVLAIALALPIVAQNVNVKRVNDRRTSGRFFAQLTIALELPNVRATDVAASRVLVTSAVDNTGRDLVDATNEASLEPSSPTGDSGTEPATVSVALKNPDRRAATVKEVRGTIELYMPSKDPNSVAEIARFLSFSGKPLAHKALKANGVELSLVSAAQIDAEKNRLAQAKRKELTAAGFDGEDLESMVKSYAEPLLALDDGELLVRIKDPNKRVHEIAFLAGGEAKRVLMREDEGFVRLSTWGEAPQADWGLRVRMKTAKNLVRQPFALKDVPLP